MWGRMGGFVGKVAAESELLFVYWSYNQAGRCNACCLVSG